MFNTSGIEHVVPCLLGILFYHGQTNQDHKDRSRNYISPLRGAVVLTVNIITSPICDLLLVRARKRQLSCYLAHLHVHVHKYDNQ